MMIGYGDDDGDYDDKDYFRMNIISTLLSNTKSWEWGRVKIPWMVFGWNYSLVNYLPWMLPDSAFTATPHYCWNIALPLKLCTASKAQFTLHPALALCVHPSKIFSWCSRGWRWFRIQRHHRTVRLPHHKTHAQTHSIQAFASPSVPLMRSPRLRWCVAGCIISVNSLHPTKEPQLILSRLDGLWTFIERDILDILESFHRMIDGDQVDSFYICSNI